MKIIFSLHCPSHECRLQVVMWRFATGGSFQLNLSRGTQSSKFSYYYRIDEPLPCVRHSVFRYVEAKSKPLACKT